MFNVITNKVKKLKSVKKIKEDEINLEISILQEISNKIIKLNEELVDYQAKYFTTIEKTNNYRASKTRQMLDLWEKKVTELKTSWLTTFKKIEEMKNKHETQSVKLLKLKKSLRSIEILEEKHLTNLKYHFTKEEQKEIDEFTNNRKKRNTL